MKLTTRTARGGFTLIELLVVLAIILILIGLTGAALQKGSESQKNRSTEDALNKLQPALQRQYEAVIHNCARDARDGKIPSQVTAYCGGDVDRAKAVWTAFQLRRHFPQTFAEATARVEIRQGLPPGPVTVVYFEPPLTPFSKVAGLNSGTPDEQSTALLFIILNDVAVDGSGGFAADDVTTGMQRDVTFTGPNNRQASLKTFGDAWGNSIGFVRWEQNAETDTKDYRDPKSNFPDPLDPLNKVAGWTLPNGTAYTQGRTEMAQQFGFNNRNRLPTVYSAGKDKALTLPFGGVPSDDLLGYRLQRLGNRGK